jgi:hypothetical protein
VPKDRYQSGRNKDARNRAFFGGGPGHHEESQVDPKRELWGIHDAGRAIDTTLVFRRREEAEDFAARLNKEYGTAYETRLIDDSKSIRKDPVVLDQAAPDPDKDLIFDLLQTQAAKYGVSGRPDDPDAYLKFLVRDGDNQEKRIHIRMSKYELMLLAEHIFGSLARR